MSTAKEIENSFNVIIALISEYENRNEKPTLEGFAGWLERKKTKALMDYQQMLEARVRAEAVEVRNKK